MTNDTISETPLAQTSPPTKTDGEPAKPDSNKSKGFFSGGRSLHLKGESPRKWYDFSSFTILPNGSEFSSYNATFFVEPFENSTFEIVSSDKFPSGLSLKSKQVIGPDGTNSTAAELSGFPLKAGTFFFDLKATNPETEVTVSRSFLLTITLNLDIYASDAIGNLVRADGSGERRAEGGLFTSAFHAGDRDLPLDEVEFLAYKAVQAYDDEKTLSDHIGQDNRLSNFRFFNSADIDRKYKGPGIIRRKNQEKEALLAMPESRVTQAAKYMFETDDPTPKQVKEARKTIIDRMIRADTQGFGFVFQGKAFIVFRGTTSSRDWRIDLDVGLTDTPDTDMERNWGWLKFWERKGENLNRIVTYMIGPDNLKPARHIGFARGFAAVQDQVEDWINSLPNGPDGYSYVFTGHSLGGALAVVGAYEFARQNRDVFAVVTFGAPSVGKAAALIPQDESETAAAATIPQPAPAAEMAPTSAPVAVSPAVPGDGVIHFVDAYSSINNGALEQRTIRLQTGADAVPRLLALFGYGHVGREWPIVLQPLPPTMKILQRKYIVKPAFAIILGILVFMYASRDKTKGKAGDENADASDASRASESTSQASDPLVQATTTGVGIFGLYRAIKEDNLQVDELFAAKGVDRITMSRIVGALLIHGRTAMKAVAAHSAERRYALFLTTLAYRKYRADHTKGFNEGTAESYQTAHAFLNQHLEHTRGPATRVPRYYFWSRPRFPSPREITNQRMESSLTRKFLSERNFEYVF